MENEKNNNDYNNESYLDKRIKPDDLQSVGVLDEIEDKKEEKSINPPEKDTKSKDKQKEMHSKIVRKKSKDFTMPLILGAVVLIMVGIVAAYFLLGIKITPQPQKENPQQIIKSAMQEMQKVKTYSYNGVIEFDVENKETYENFNFNVELSGKADQADINNIKSFNNLKAKIDVPIDGDRQEFSFNLDTMQFGQKKTYLKLNDFDLGIIGIRVGPQFNSLIDSFKGNWYKLDLEELEKLSAASSGSVSGMSMTTYDVNKIMALYNKYELLKFQENLGDVKLGDIDVCHYKVRLDGIALVNFYVDIMKEVIAEMNPAEKGEILTEEFDEVFKEIEDSIEKYDYAINKVADNVNIEIWIGKNDRLIYRTKIYGEFDKEFIEMIGNEMIAKGDISEEDFMDELNKDEDASIAFYADIRMSDFNQPVEINEPEEAENLMEFLEGMMTSGISSGDSDQDRLSDNAETIYGTDPNNPDTDGDGYTDGDEVSKGYDPLVPGNAKLDYDKLFKM
ncbi:MAG: hypothetical protein KAQ87_03895 [Candidatus Pacebacteria bacterium]|nr:hypothetical protein [Candidatus Paceibacterota bacterium]